MNESPKQSHIFVRALKTQAMSDMDYRAEVLKQFPGYKQIPNIVSPLKRNFLQRLSFPCFTTCVICRSPRKFICLPCRIMRRAARETEGLPFTRIKTNADRI